MCNGNCRQSRECDCADSVVNVLWAFSVIGLSAAIIAAGYGIGMIVGVIV